MKRHLIAVAVAGLGLATAIGSTAALAKPNSKAPSQCFYSRDWNGWKATEDSKALYIRAGISRIFKLDLAGSCPALNMPGVHLVTRLHGPWICHALDLDLHVSDGHMSTPCIVSKVTALTPEEAAALPPSVRP